MLQTSVHRSRAVHVSSQLCVRGHHWSLEITHGGHIYTMETGKCYISGLSPMEGRLLNIYLHILDLHSHQLHSEKKSFWNLVEKKDSRRVRGYREIG